MRNWASKFAVKWVSLCRYAAVWHHMALLLLEAFRIKTPILRNEQPAYTEAVYLWRHYLAGGVGGLAIVYPYL
jgi:hypothetical protein